MIDTMSIRAVVREDVSALKKVIESTGLFSSALLDDMLVGYWSGESAHWLTCDEVGEAVAVAYFVPEQMTEGTWNVLLLAVRVDRQGMGLGAALMARTEQVLAERGERLLLVETSGLPEFEQTRSFYRKNGYEEEARIRDFYTAGEDKIIFRKVIRD